MQVCVNKAMFILCRDPWPQETKPQQEERPRSEPSPPMWHAQTAKQQRGH